MKRVVPLWLAAFVGVASAGPAQAQVLFGLTSGGSLVQFNSATPGTLIGAALPITGLATGDSLVGVDLRPSDGSLVGLAYATTGANPNTARAYSINTTTGAATQLPGSTNIPAGAGVTGFGVDFNPAANAFRIVTNATTGNNLRVPTGGAGTPVTDSNLNPGTPSIQAIAYTNNFAGTSVTTLYGIDAFSGNLVTIGGQNGSPSPNLGQVITVAALTGATASQVTGFDIAGQTGTAFLTTGGSLFSLNLGTGAASSLGTFAAGTTIVDISAIPEPGSLALCGLAVAGLAGYRRLKRKTVEPTA